VIEFFAACNSDQRLGFRAAAALGESARRLGNPQLRAAGRPQEASQCFDVVFKRGVFKTQLRQPAIARPRRTPHRARALRSRQDSESPGGGRRAAGGGPFPAAAGGRRPPQRSSTRPPSSPSAGPVAGGGAAASCGAGTWATALAMAGLRAEREGRETGREEGGREGGDGGQRMQESKRE
jgi:hypothetical protein